MEKIVPLLSICSNSVGDAIHIHADAQGLAMLQCAISNLQKN
ncbi:hypothetical protein ACFFU8_15250 [Chromobacterium piscinae]|nr:hypothetical protein [Chromobacterium piscinae]